METNYTPQSDIVDVNMTRRIDNQMRIAFSQFLVKDQTPSFCIISMILLYERFGDHIC